MGPGLPLGSLWAGMLAYALLAFPSGRLEALDGELDLDSVVGAGTTIRVRLPCR